jgi:hypothetical protein
VTGGESERSQPATPHSIEAERAILGALLVDCPRFWPQAREALAAHAFFRHAHQLVFRAIEALTRGSEAVEPVAAFLWLQAQGLAEQAGGLPAVNDLAAAEGTAATDATFAAAVAMVRDLDTRRRGIAETYNTTRQLLDTASGSVSEVLERGAERLKALQQGAGPNRQGHREFALLTARELGGLTPLTWSVRNLLPSAGLAAIYGPSGAGKSFLVADLAAAGGEGREWFGYGVKGGQRWVYLALEGKAGIQRRVAAWERHRERPFPEGVRFAFDPFKLTSPADVRALAAAVEAYGGADVVVVDTLNRATPGADENSSVDTGLAIEAAQQLQAMTGGLVLLVHHSGKDATKAMRGHSSLFAAMDAVIKVTKTDDGRREWSAEKVKDGEDGAAHNFRLDVIELGQDDDGEEITSCVVVPERVEAEDRSRPRRPQGGNQRIVLDALGKLLRESRAYGRAGAPPTRPCVTLEDALEKIAPQLAVDPKRRRERVQTAITGLQGSGLVQANEGWLWLA